jgi:hypothetical protein
VPELFEIVNPSDPYTIQGEREPVCAAALLLGNGMYPVVPVAGGPQVLPFLALSGEDGLDTWWREAFGRSFSESLQLRGAVAEALESVMIGSAADRARMERVLAAISSPEDRERARAAWHDERRSSTNDIGRQAAALAARIRAQERSAA